MVFQRATSVPFQTKGEERERCGRTEHSDPTEALQISLNTKSISEACFIRFIHPVVQHLGFSVPPTRVQFYTSSFDVLFTKDSDTQGEA